MYIKYNFNSSKNIKNDKYFNCFVTGKNKEHIFSAAIDSSLFFVCFFTTHQ